MTIAAFEVVVAAAAPSAAVLVMVDSCRG